MDIGQFNFKDAEPHRVELTNPANEETLRGEDGQAVWIMVHGADSNVFRAAMRSYGNKKLQKASKKQTVEELEQVSCKVLAAATTGWSNNFTVSGQMLEFSQQNAEWLYTEFQWIREQVDTFVNDRSNFLPSA